MTIVVVAAFTDWIKILGSIGGGGAFVLLAAGEVVTASVKKKTQVNDTMEKRRRDGFMLVI
jgi:glucose uptake protein GlcU